MRCAPASDVCCRASRELFCVFLALCTVSDWRLCLHAFFAFVSFCVRVLRALWLALLREQLSVSVVFRVRSVPCRAPLKSCCALCCFALLLPRRALSCHLASAVLSEHLSASRCVSWLLPRLFCAGAVSASGSDAAFELHVVPPSQSSAELSHIVDTFAAATDADLATGQQALQSQLREVLASTAKSIQLVVGGAARVRA